MPALPWFRVSTAEPGTELTQALNAFVRTNPHEAAMAAIHPEMDNPTFAFWRGEPWGPSHRVDEARRRFDEKPQRSAPSQ